VAAREVMRKDLIPYFSLPFYRAMIERSGFEPDIEKADGFIATLAGIGTADEANAVIDRYFEAGATSAQSVRPFSHCCPTLNT